METYIQINKILEDLKEADQLKLGTLSYFPTDSDEEDDEEAEEDLPRLYHQVCQDAPFLIEIDLVPFTVATVKGKPIEEQDLLPQAVPSAYGDLKEGTTKVNLDVRKAHEIKDVVITPKMLQSVDGILPCVSEQLFGDRKVRAVFDKVNLYSKGGFFQEHVDTPKVGRVGTLIVQLPGTYEGGLAFGSQHFGASAKLKLLAFYGNCPHQITPITNGTRISLTFHLLSTDSYQTEKVQVPYTLYGYEHSARYVTPGVQKVRKLDTSKAREIRIQRLIRQLQENVKEQKLGLILPNSYSNHELNVNSLKNPENYLYYTSKLQGQLIPIVIVQETEIYQDSQDSNYQVFRCSPEDIDALVAKKPVVPTGDPMQFIGCDTKGIVLKADYGPYIEFTGNESQIGWKNNLYFTTALILSEDCL